MEDVSWQQHFGEEDMQHLLAPAEPRPFRHEAANRNHSQQHQRYFQCSTEHLLHFSPFPFGCKKATHCWAFLYLKRSIANNKPQLSRSKYVLDKYHPFPPTFSLWTHSWLSAQ